MSSGRWNIESWRWSATSSRLQADVVRPALDQHGGEFQARDRAEERDVLLEQLLLKCDRVGRDDDLFLVLDRRLDRRDQVGEALAHAGSRLDHQVAGPLDRARDPLGHLDLLGAMFVGWQSSRDGATGAKDRNRIQICHARGHRAKRKSAFSSNQSKSHVVPTQVGRSLSSHPTTGRRHAYAGAVESVELYTPLALILVPLRAWFKTGVVRATVRLASLKQRVTYELHKNDTKWQLFGGLLCHLARPGGNPERGSLGDGLS